MKIRKLRLKGVRCFDDFEIDFTHPYTGETLNRIVLVGVNGSGKTTILEAIFFLLEVAQFSSDHVLSSEHLSSLQSSRFLPYPGEVEGEIQISTDPPVQIRILPVRGEMRIVRDPNVVHAIDFLHLHHLGSLIYFPSPRQLPIVDLKSLAEEKVEPQFAYRYSDMVGADGRGSLHSYVVYQNYLDLLELEKNGTKGPRFGRIKALFDRVFISKRLVGVEDLDVIVETDDGGHHDINELSSGEKQMFLLLVDLLRHEPKHSIILIDEPELSFHPQWQRQLFSLIEEIGEDNQIIMATHSTEILKTVLPEEVFMLSELVPAEEEPAPVA